MHQQTIPLGEAAISPSGPQIAGTTTTITLTYRAGHPMDDTGSLKIAFRYASDFGTPQFTDPAAPNYCSVRTTPDCTFEASWDPKGHTRPWGKALRLKVMRGYVDEGDKIVITFGDTSGGSPGWQLPTFCESTFEFKTLVDPIATLQYKELPHSPTLQIVPGEPARALCIAPSQVVASDTFTWYLKLEDRWGNPVAKPQPFRHEGFAEPGIQQLTAEDPETGLSAVSNPIRVLPEAPATGRYWAELHGQSEETIGTNTIHDYFTFARDYGLVDAAAHQGNDFQITDDFWQTINDTTRDFYEPGSFVTFPGYEWSGNTPLGGDRNVFYDDEGGPIYRSCFDLLPDQTAEHQQAGTANQLFAKLRQVDSPAPFCYAHVGGRYSDIRQHDEELELAVEVHSAWGTFEWMIEDAIRLGYRVGIVANSDGHKGRPGASYPGASRFGSLGGLTCILAKKLDRASILAALRQRHCYATTGHRPLLDVTATTSNDEHPMMGDILHTQATSATVHISAVGTAPIESIELRQGLETIAVHRPAAANGNRIKLIWSGSEVRGRARKVSWDGGLRLADNAISAMQAINFWNADRQPIMQNSRHVTWQSITTGGLTGLMLTLDHANQGHLTCQTEQGDIRIDIADLTAEPTTWEFGGLAKQIAAYRLPDQLPTQLSLNLPVDTLHQGDNPLYVKVNQTDGHIAWSSPIYLVRNH